MKRCLLVAAVVVCCGATRGGDEAPADAWPMARGCAAGTGRSAATLAFPLSEAWQRSCGKTAFEATPVIADGTIYVGDLDGTFHAMALADGAPRWTFRIDVGFPSAAAVSTDASVPLVVVGDAAGIVRALDIGTGKVRWEYATDGEISGGPTIVPGSDGLRVLVGSQDASLTCLSLADGKQIWKHSIADQIRCSPTVAAGAVFIAGCDGKLHVIDAATGTPTGSVPIDGPTGTTPAARGDRIFFGTEGGVFFAIDAGPPAVAWRAEPAAKGQSYRSSAAMANSLAIVGSRARALESFHVEDGSRGWRLPMRGRVDASPIVIRGADGAAAAIVGDSAGRVVAVDVATGAPLWEFDAGGGFTGGAAVAAGKLVLASEDGTIWCFRSHSTPGERP